MTKIIIVISVMIAAAVMGIMPCYVYAQYTDEDLRVFDGKVVNVDVGGSRLTVKGSLQMDFSILPDTSLQKDGQDIKLSDISNGDYVTVQYYRKGSESRVPDKVIMVTVEYGPGGWQD